MKYGNYAGPVRDEPLAIEFHNTVYAVRGRQTDGLADKAGLGAWLAAVRDRLPAEARAADPIHLNEFLELRAAIRSAVAAAVGGREVPSRAFEVINTAASRAPTSPRLVRLGSTGVGRSVSFHSPDPEVTVLAMIAASAIEVLGGPLRSKLRFCGAPGCVLAFVKAHPRREWCSSACGNRARQARHYKRVRTPGS